MKRIPPSADVELVGQVLRSIPGQLGRLLDGVALMIDTDPIWTGLHFNEGNGRSLRNTSHVCYKFGQQHLPKSIRESTVVLLDHDHLDREVILHELGHILDERMGFDRPTFRPLGPYAATHHVEAFATAFQAWMTPAGPDRSCDGYFSRDDLMRVDLRAAAFFNSLGERKVA